MRLLLPIFRPILTLLAVSSLCSFKYASSSEVVLTCPVRRSVEEVTLLQNGEDSRNVLNESLSVSYRWTYASEEAFVTCQARPTPLAAVLSGRTCLPALSSSAFGGEVKLCYDEADIYLTAFGSHTVYSLPEAAQVSLCSNSTYPLLLTWTSGSTDRGQLVFANTGCGAAWGSDVLWFPGSQDAVQNPSSQYAAAAGFPTQGLVSQVSSSSLEDPSNPCISPGAGYSAGLTAQFYSAPFVKGQTDLPLSFGPANFTRCDCPNHQVAGTPWSGSPALPQSYANNFGAGLSGEILVAQASDVPVDVAAWKLVCLQYNGAVKLTMDGQTLLASSNASSMGAGYHEECQALQLSEGWHKLSILYGDAATVPLSILRLFLVDAVGTGTGSEVKDSTASEDTIIWEYNGALCAVGNTSGSAETAQACNQPYECCNFRTSYGCGSGLLKPGAPLPLPVSPPVSLPPAAIQYVLPPYNPSSQSGLGGLPSGTSTPPQRNTTTSAPAAAPGPSGTGQVHMVVSPVTAEAPAPARSVSAQLPTLTAPKPSASPAQTLPPAPTKLAQAPANLESPLQAILPLPKQPLLSSGAPVQYALPQPPPPPAGIVPCSISAEPCWVYQVGSGVQMRMVSLTCNNSSTATVRQYTARITYGQGNSTGWLSVSPTTGNLNTDVAVPFMLTINTTALAAGEYPATLEIMEQDSAGNGTMILQDLLLVLPGPARTRLSSINSGADNSALVAASTSLDLPTRRTSVTTNVTLSSKVDTKYFFFQSSPFAGAVSEFDYQLNSSIAIPSPYEASNTSLLLEAAYEVALPLGGYSTFTCGTVYSQTAASIPVIPQCQLFSVDMAFCGQNGLVTSQAEAQIVLACTRPVTICADCISISGPSQSSVQLLTFASNSTFSTAHHALVRWPTGYSGPITVDLQQQRSIPGCSLSTALLGQNATIAPVNPLQFVVQESTPIRSAAYQLLGDCEGSQCSFDV